MRLGSIAAAISVLFLVLWSGGCGHSVEQVDRGAADFLGQHAVHVLARPTRVQGMLYRASDGTSLGSPTPRSLDLSVAHELREIFFDEDSYVRTGPPAAFRKDVGFRVWRDEQSVEIHLSFTNDQLLVRTRSPGGPLVIQYASFTATRKELRALAKKAFPDLKMPG